MIAVLLYMLSSATAVSAYSGQRLASSPLEHTAPLARHDGTNEMNPSERVPFEIHIMSKCPDAQYCLSELVVPAMDQVRDLVDFNVSYIGMPHDDDVVVCQHGPTECEGNILELMVAHLNPAPIVHLGFTNCMTQQYPLIPDRGLVEACARVHNVDLEKLYQLFADKAFGLKLLRESVIRSDDQRLQKSDNFEMDMDMNIGGGTACKTNMLWNRYTIDACAYRIRGDGFD
ncbi:hypothetical protein DL764_006228 [Monosporascus ibericus]|uniref:Gamma interferon inducible lysosomal thiol reductase GILT n=1 Tax=Monosporascus ibericus TaxID=155417 RepID=A0A4Q4T7C7_9PEZI|nr:hypothetical protein DL764_006228 [Monosporascus ibericus]